MRIYLALLVCAFIAPLVYAGPPSGINGFPLMVPPLFGFDTFKLPNCQGEKIFGGVFPAACTQMGPGVYRTAIEANQQVTVYECSETGCPLSSCNVTVVSFVNGTCDTPSNAIYAYYTSLPNITTPASAITFEQFISPCALVETSGIGYFAQSLCVPNGDGSYFLGSCQNTNSSLVSLSTCTDSECKNCQSEMIIADDCANSNSMYHCPKGDNGNGGNNGGPGIEPPFWGFISYLEPNCSGVMVAGRLHNAACAQFTATSWKKATYNATSGEIKVFTCSTDKCDTNCVQLNQNFINGTCNAGLNMMPYYSDTDFPSISPPSGSTILRGYSDDCVSQSMIGFTLPRVCARVFDHFEKANCDGSGISFSSCTDSACANCQQVFVQPSQCFHFGNEFTNVQMECQQGGNNQGGPDIVLPAVAEMVFANANCSGNLLAARAVTSSCHPVGTHFEHATFNPETGNVTVFTCSSNDCASGCTLKTHFINGTCTFGSKLEFWPQFPNIPLPTGATIYSGATDVACTSQSTVVGFQTPSSCVKIGNSFSKLACNGTQVTVSLNCTSSTCATCSHNLVHDADKCNSMPDGFDFPFARYECAVDNTTVAMTASISNAVFSPKGDTVLVNWVFNGGILPLIQVDTGLFPCSRYFSGQLVNGASCLWNSSGSIQMFITASVISFPANLTLIGSTKSVTLNGVKFTINIVGQTVVVNLPENLSPPIPVLVTPVSVNSCFKVRLDGSKSLGVALKFSWTIAPSVDLSLVSGLDKPILDLAPFALTGGNSTVNYTIILTVSNIWGLNSSVSNVISVNNGQLMPQVTILSDKTIQWLPSFALRLDSIISFPASCSFNMSGTNLTFGWKVFLTSNLTSPVLTANQKSQLLIPGGTLGAGSYKATFALTFKGVTVSDSVDLVFVFPSPIAVLKPIAVKVGPNQNITLDASPSLFVTSDTTYTWTCFHNSSPCQNVNNQTLTFASTPVIHVNSSTLTSDTSFTFCISVHNSQGTSSDCVTLAVIPEIPPLVAIVPPGVVNPAEKLVLKGAVFYLLSFSRLSFEWTVTSGSLTLGKSNATTLVINANTLTPSVTYTLKLTVTDTVSNVNNFATVTFTVNGPPTGGSLVIDPSTTGIQYNTTFSVSCIGATDSDSPLSYRFGYQYEGETASYFIGSFQTASSTFTTFAKVGLVRIFVLVSDSFGSFTKIVSGPVNITKNEGLDTKAVATETLNTLTDILATGDATGALNTLAGVGQLLGQGSQLSESDKQTLGTNLVNSLKTLTEINEILSDPSSVENVANTVLLASQTSVSADLQKQALGLVGTLVGSGQLSESGARSLVGVISSCFSSAGNDDTFVSDISDVLHNLWTSQVGNLAPGEDPLVLISDNLQLVAAKLDAFTSSNPIESGDSSCGFQFASPDSQGELSIQMVSYNDDYSPQAQTSPSKVVEVNLNGGQGNFEVTVTIPLKNPIEGTASCQFRNAFGNGWSSDNSCELVEQQATFITCKCSHLTQFSAGEKAVGTTPGSPGSPGSNVIGLAVGIPVAVVVVIVVVIVGVVIYRKSKGKTAPWGLQQKKNVKTTPVEAIPKASEESGDEESGSATDSHTATASHTATSTSYSKSKTHETSHTSTSADSDDS